MFVDEVEITLKGGDGGPGGKHFLRQKFRPNGGPSGGDGGDGGSVFFVARTNLSTLNQYRNRQAFLAENGQAGMRNKMIGKAGDDLFLEVPRGTVIKDKLTGEVLADITIADEPVLIAPGGKGGKGNYHFATSKNQAPAYAQPGLPGLYLDLELELKLIADVGFVGLPNAGKSTLLKALTNATPKIGSYPFTTLFPNLGVMQVFDRQIVLADIPGLIEGASTGIGLGDEFLRHIERTEYIVHLLDVSGFSGDPAYNYRAINKELAQYSEKLANKKQLVVFNKTDVPESEALIAAFKESVPELQEFVAISAITGDGLDKFTIALSQRFAKS